MLLLFDHAVITNFAEDNFMVRWDQCMQALIKNKEKKLEAMTEQYTNVFFAESHQSKSNRRDVTSHSV